LKILYLTNGMSSTLNSSFEVSRRLIAAGHEVTYASQADVSDRVTAQGYSFTRLAADEKYVDAAKRQPLRWVDLLRPARFARRVKLHRRLRRESIANDEIERFIGELAPDLLLVDMEMHFALIAAAKLGIPTLLPIVWFTLFRHRGLPPMHTDLQPEGGGGDRRAIEKAWDKLRISTLVGEWRRRLAQVKRCELFRPVAYETFRIEDLQAVAKSRGYDLSREVRRDQWLRPFLYRNLPILVFNAREMEFPHEPHPNNHYVGPMVFRKRREAQVTGDAGTEWREFRERRDPRRPLVYCSLGSFWSADEVFLKKVLQAFEARPEWDLVLGLGGKLTSAELAPIPSNAIVLGFAPQLEVLELADCAITHGGITTINECIQAGVPMVVYSTRHVDQEGCAARLAFHRLGIVANKDSDDAAAIESNVERALNDPQIRTNVQTMRAHFARYEEENELLRIVEQAARGESVA